MHLVTPASALAVSLEDAKLHLRVDDATDDDLITALIVAATEMAEQKTSRAIMPQTFDLSLDAFPDAIELTRTPVTSVTSITYIDVDGATKTLSSSVYALNTASDYDFASIAPAYGQVWPATRAQENAVVVRYVAGYTAAPESIKAWIKLAVGTLYANRESEVTGNGGSITLGFADRLLDAFKLRGV